MYEAYVKNSPDPAPVDKKKQSMPAGNWNKSYGASPVSLKLLPVSHAFCEAASTQSFKFDNSSDAKTTPYKRKTARLIKQDFCNTYLVNKITVIRRDWFGQRIW